MNFSEFGFTMGHGEQSDTPFAAEGQRIRRLREAKGLSRRELADRLKINVTSLAGWEGGKRLPRDGVRLRLARVLGADLDALFSSGTRGEACPIAASVVDTMEELPDLLMELTERARQTLRALRLAAPYSTPAHVQTEWRNLISKRLLDGTLEVHRIEIFYDLRRLQEVLSNIIRYDGRPYYVKCHCPGIADVIPAMGGYFFDDDEFLLGAYWTGVPPQHRSGLRMSGPPFRHFFEEYWDEIWRRGILLNIGGAHDLSAVQSLAFALGLPIGEWDRFLTEAKALDIGDGAPPLV